MNAIDSTARVERGAEIGSGATIGPYCVIGKDVVIGDGCHLIAHVHVTGHTSIGRNTVIYPFASLGTPPQSVKYRGGATRLIVGSGCDIRESVTMNLGTEDAGGLIRVGDRGLFIVCLPFGHQLLVWGSCVCCQNGPLRSPVRPGGC